MDDIQMYMLLLKDKLRKEQLDKMDYRIGETIKKLQENIEICEAIRHEVNERLLDLNTLK